MKWVRRVFVFLVVLLAVFWGGVNVLLATDLGPKLANLSPKDAQFHWKKARMPWPFVIEADGFEMFVQDPNIQMHITAEHARAVAHPLQALRLQIYITDIVADGVSFRMRQRFEEGQRTEKEIAALPPIEAWDSPLREGPATFPDQLPFIRLPSITVHHARELWIDEYRYEGELDVSGGFELQPLAHLKVFPTDIQIQPGTISFGEKVPLKVDRSAIHAKSDRIFFETANQESLRQLDVVAKVQVDVRGASWANAYLKDVPGVRVVDGAGRLNVDLTIKDGVIDPASRVQLVTDRLLVRVPYLDVVGKAEIDGQVEGDRPVMHVSMKSVKLEQRSDHATVLQGGQFTLVAAASSTDLSKPQSLDLDLELGHAKAPDLSFLNAWIPDGSGVRVFSGDGELSGHFALSAATNHGHGKLGIDARHLAIKNRSAVLTGRAAIHGVFNDVNFKSGAMDLSGSNLRINDVEVATPTRRDKGFWLSLVAPKARFAPEDHWDTNLDMRFSNVQPLLTVVTATFHLPEILAAVVNVPEVHVTTDLLVGDKKVTLSHLKVDSEGALSAEANVVLRETGQKEDKHLEPWGLALVTLKPLVVGIDLQGDTVKPMLADPVGWYRKSLGQD